MSIRIIVTGGTFDKEYDELTGSLRFRETHLPEMLRRGRSMLEVQVDVLMMIDSLEMLHHHRQQIVDACLRVPESRLVITHGTDTMAETAQVLAAAVPGKTIVLTGAMVPYAFGSSDALFNLAARSASRRHCRRSVSRDERAGRYFAAGRRIKNREVGVFEESPSTPT